MEHCPICNKSFKTKAGLQGHRRMKKDRAHSSYPALQPLQQKKPSIKSKDTDITTLIDTVKQQQQQVKERDEFILSLQNQITSLSTELKEQPRVLQPTEKTGTTVKEESGRWEEIPDVKRDNYDEYLDSLAKQGFSKEWLRMKRLEHDIWNQAPAGRRSEAVRLAKEDGKLKDVPMT